MPPTTNHSSEAERHPHPRGMPKKNQHFPSEAEHARLSETFDRLSRRETGYDALDERIRKTANKREQLLTVLELPHIPLHDNDMELVARRRVRKRDVSFGPQSRAGVHA